MPQKKTVSACEAGKKCGGSNAIESKPISAPKPYVPQKKTVSACEAGKKCGGYNVKKTTVTTDYIKPSGRTATVPTVQQKPVKISVPLQKPCTYNCAPEIVPVVVPEPVYGAPLVEEPPVIETLPEIVPVVVPEPVYGAPLVEEPPVIETLPDIVPVVVPEPVYGAPPVEAYVSPVIETQAPVVDIPVGY